MRKVTVEELKQIASEQREAVWNQAESVGREPKIFLHWTAGHYFQKFEDYHINITANGDIWLMTEDLSEVLAHTWRRNTGSIGVTLCCCAGATTNDLGDEPPTSEQIEAMAQVVAVLAEEYDIPLDTDEYVMTHDEAAELDGYGHSTTCERWDLWYVPDYYGADGALEQGGDLIRGKAAFYQRAWRNEYAGD